MFLEMFLELLADLSVLFVEDVAADRPIQLSWLRYGLAWVIYLAHLGLLLMLAAGTVILSKAMLGEQEKWQLLLALLLALITVFWLWRCMRLTKLMWRASVLRLRRKR
ncbi:hypothetical protein ACVRZR_00905 [Streptococcus entericus]|uniref:hypothetical protein n=1 Tax=Streptococcus entericus TaxID=155680 RepID=UPI0003665A52|nr:hypothetical protein [Streptococcus entericus]